MSFITDDHEEFRSAVRKFTDEEIVPIAADIDSYKYPDIPQEIIKKMAKRLELSHREINLYVNQTGLDLKNYEILYSFYNLFVNQTRYLHPYH